VTKEMKNEEGGMKKSFSRATRPARFFILHS
jgi:hypothetical protein